MAHKAITDIIISQFRAGLGMLKEAIIKIPDDLWQDKAYNNPNWQIAYHVLWVTKFYLSKDPESYVSFKNAIEGAESLGGMQDWEKPGEGVKVAGHHTKPEILSFINNLETDLQENIESLPFEGSSGFEWYPYTRLELHINSIRHIQHHTAQIIERLKAAGITGFPWWADQHPPQGW